MRCSWPRVARRLHSFLWNNVSTPESIATNSARTMERFGGDNYSSGPPVSHGGRTKPRASRSRSAPAVFRDGSAPSRATTMVRSQNRRAGPVPLVGMPWRWPVASLSTATALCDTPVSDPRAVYALPTGTLTFGPCYSCFTILPPCAHGGPAVLGRSGGCRTAIQRGWYSGNGVYIPAGYVSWLAYLGKGP